MFYHPHYYYGYPVPLPQPVHDHSYPLWSREPYAYPPIDTTFFHQSTVAFQSLIKQASVILDKLAASQELCAALMKAAQQGNQAEVDRIVKSTGVTTAVTTVYTPTSVQFLLQAPHQGGSLALNLRWGQ
jgi:hypothetical protein